MELTKKVIMFCGIFLTCFREAPRTHYVSISDQSCDPSLLSTAQNLLKFVCAFIKIYSSPSRR